MTYQQRCDRRCKCDKSLVNESLLHQSHENATRKDGDARDERDADALDSEWSRAPIDGC